DACRTNPFERRFRGASGGLASIDAPAGTLIAYATAPGKVAVDSDNQGTYKNSIYTSALLEALGQPNLTIEQVFKRVRVKVATTTNDAQVPWESSSLTGDFYFRPPTQAASTQSPTLADGDILFWESILNSRDPSDYRAYLQQFPNGRFAAIARKRAIPPRTQ